MGSLFKLHAGINVEALREGYQERRRVRIDPFLAPEGAEALRSDLLAREDWVLKMKGDAPKTYQFERQKLSNWQPQQVEAVRKMAAPTAEGTFNYLYDSILLSDENRKLREGETPAGELASFLCSDEVVDLVVAITGDESIAFADAFASRYGPGDFLTIHHDKKAGSNRLAAYVLGLTVGWRPEWGGLLLFHDTRGDVESGLSPGFNVLNLFGVPQDHSVSQVAPFAPMPRLSVTGWFRAIPSKDATS